MTAAMADVDVLYGDFLRTPPSELDAVVEHTPRQQPRRLEDNSGGLGRLVLFVQNVPRSSVVTDGAVRDPRTLEAFERLAARLASTPATPLPGAAEPLREVNNS